uniref:(northern house mosquito) hypothetical protein n=1 Tax=Culex pipiens TaxID=7175 RepID=A0A8D8FBH9_CULPI
MVVLEGWTKFDSKLASRRRGGQTLNSCTVRTAIRDSMAAGRAEVGENHRRGRGAAFEDTRASGIAGSAVPPFRVRPAGKRPLRTIESRLAARTPRRPRPRCTTSRTRCGCCHGEPSSSSGRSHHQRPSLSRRTRPCAKVPWRRPPVGTPSASVSRWP